MNGTDRELVTSRVVAGTPARVFEAFREPARLARWWGPRGFTNTFEECDLRPGGTWSFVMHGPDGRDYRNRSVFEEIDPGRVFALRHVSGPMFRLRVTLDPEGGRTRITWRMTFDTAAERDRVAVYAVDANEQNLDRLEAELEEP